MTPAPENPPALRPVFNHDALKGCVLNEAQAAAFRRRGRCHMLNDEQTGCTVVAYTDSSGSVFIDEIRPIARTHPKPTP